jgi:hypothetical protein
MVEGEMSNTNTKIWLFLLAATGALLCAGCATENYRVSQRDIYSAEAQLIIFQHGREFGEYVQNAYRAFGPDQTKWTQAQFAAYLRGLYGMLTKYGYAANP